MTKGEGDRGCALQQYGWCAKATALFSNKSMRGMSCRMQDEIVLTCVSLVPVTCRPDTARGCISTAAAHNRGWTKDGTHTKEGPRNMALQNGKLQGRDMACIYPTLSSFLTPLRRCRLKLGTAVLPVLAWLQSSAADQQHPQVGIAA